MMARRHIKRGKHEPGKMKSGAIAKVQNQRILLCAAIPKSRDSVQHLCIKDDRRLHFSLGSPPGSTSLIPVIIRFNFFLSEQP
jgi:hypothetical protein